MKKRKTQSAKVKTDVLSLILSVVFGAIWCFVGGVIYQRNTGKIHPILLMCIYFGGLAITLILASFICNKLKGYKMPKKKDYTKAFITVGVIIAASALFQFIYSVNINLESSMADRATFVFLIDDSTSMDTTDPLNERYEAIKDVMKEAGKDKQFCVYSFHTFCTRLTDMLDAKEAQTLHLNTKTDGDTRIVNALNTVLEDAKSGAIRCPRGSRIILLTDGYSTELFSALKLRDTLSEANSRGISVSAVGFGDCDDEYLQNIANMTEGKFVHAIDASDIGKAMLRVSLENSDYRRDLINHRNPTKGFVEYLYGFERLLFIVLLGVAFIYLKSLVIRTNNPDSNIMIAHIIIVAVGALGIEIGMNVFYLSEWIMRLIMCVCFTLIYLTEKKHSYSYNDDSSYLDGSWSVGAGDDNSSYDSYSTSYDDLYN